MVPEEITPMVPAVVGEKVADDPTCFILETLLKYMVIQVMTIFAEEDTTQLCVRLCSGYNVVITSVSQV